MIKLDVESRADENVGGHSDVLAGISLVDVYERMDNERKASNVDFIVALASRNGIVTFFDVDHKRLQRDLKNWKCLFPAERSNDWRINVSENSRGADGTSIPKTPLGAPKHGKEDPKNEIHVGGNTWAGGTGGSDTAGLGGRGGPYRLDKGHRVHQVCCLL